MANSNSHSKQLINEESRETCSIKYRECWRNHAILIGGYAADGCREFTPKGDKGTKEALLCEACDCHRNFHRKELIKNGTTLVGSHHFHPPYGVHYSMWGVRNVLGFYPLPHHYRQWQRNNEQSLVSDEESVIYNESQSEMQIKASKRPKREPL